MLLPSLLVVSQEGHSMLVPLRPSSEALLRARAPGARDQHGCHSPSSFCEQEGWSGRSLLLAHLRQLREIVRKGLHPTGGLAPVEVFVRRMVAMLRQTQ